MNSKENLDTCRTCGNCAKCSYDVDGVYRCNRHVHWGIVYVVKPENPSCPRYEPADQ